MNDQQITITWLGDRHIGDVRAIERLSLPDEHRNFLVCNNHTNLSAVVAEVDRFCRRPAVAGYMIYEIFPRRMDVLSLAVDPYWRRQHVGTRLIGFLKHHMREPHRNRLRIDVRETNLASHLFLRSCGFRCVLEMPGFYPEGDRAYRFSYRLPTAVCAAAASEPSCEAIR